MIWCGGRWLKFVPPLNTFMENFRERESNSFVNICTIAGYFGEKVTVRVRVRFRVRDRGLVFVAWLGYFGAEVWLVFVS